MNSKAIENTDNLIAQQLAKLMSESRINASELARRTGVPQPTIYRLLHNGSNDPRFSTLASLAGYFEVALDYFTGKTGANKAFNSHAVPVFTLESLHQRGNVPHPQHDNLVTHCPNERCFAISSTASMTPKIALGSTLVIDPMKAPIDDDLVLVLYHQSNNYAVRILQKDGDVIRLRRMQPSDDAEAVNDQVEIIGTIFQITIVL